MDLKFPITIGDLRDFDLKDNLNYAYGTSDVEPDSYLMNPKLLGNKMTR